MHLKDLTVLVPTRNEADNIPAFLNSLPDEIKLIVVDASEDNTHEIIKILRPEHTRIFPCPGSVTGARQLGAENADTPWLLFTDADVIFAPDYFERLLKYEDYDALYGPKLSTDEFVRYYRWFGRGQHLSHILGIPAASGSNLLVRRDVFESVGGFDLELTCNEDSEIAWRIKRQGYHVGFGPDLHVYARDHRRLYQGVLRKTLHSMARCTLLFLNLLPSRWRRHDWGYWSSTRGGSR